MSAIGRGAGFLGMLLASLAGRGGRARGGGPPLDWRQMPLPTLDGGQLDPAALEDRVVLLVNTASRCGFTPQYRGLQTLWRAHRAAGLAVLGVPSNHFPRQEPGDAAAIRRFCDQRYGVDFPRLARQRVVGPGAPPPYVWAAAAGGKAAIPRWNFHKLLIGRDGRLLAAFTPPLPPASRRLAVALDAALRRR